MVTRPEGCANRSTIGALAVAGLAFLVSCDAAPDPLAMGVVSDSSGIRIIDLPEISPSPRRVLPVDGSWMAGFDREMGELSDLAVLEDGRIAVLDGMNGEISILLDDGSVVHTFGRHGEGPGEFSSIGRLSRLVATDSSLLVPDIQLQRITEFSLAGDVLSVWPIWQTDGSQGAVYGVEWRAHPEGGVVYRVLSSTGDLLVRAAGDALDTLHVFATPDAPPNRLLRPSPLWDVDAEGRIVMGRSDLVEIELRHPSEQRPLWISRTSRDSRQLSDEERSHLEGLLVGSAEAQRGRELSASERGLMLSAVSFPASTPVLASVLVDGRSRYWVRRAAPVVEMGVDALMVGRSSGYGGRQWHVLHADGRLAEVVNLPGEFQPLNRAGIVGDLIV